MNVTLQPDVKQLLDYVDGLELPSLASMSPQEARAFMAASAADRPPGPDVAEVSDGQLPGPAGPLNYRVYRPIAGVELPIFIYFHGGGWVLGSHESDDPLCRDLAVRSEALVVSVDYRHAPEHRFPAAIDDGLAAVQWISDNGGQLGGDTSRLVVGGWSAGGNIAAVACQLGRDNGGPRISGQVLLTPAVDCDFSRPSYVSNSDGYGLTTEIMHWFWNHYLDPEKRTDPRASPIRASSLVGIPPTFVVTCEYDPLRDEGEAYVDRLRASGVDANFFRCEGHTHTSIGAVDLTR